MVTDVAYPHSVISSFNGKPQEAAGKGVSMIWQFVHNRRSDLQSNRHLDRTPMLNAYQAPAFSDEDRVLFDRLVPYDHWTRRAAARTGFPALRKSIEHYFSREGHPAVEPVFCLKLELLMFRDALSDRQVFAKARTDIASRKLRSTVDPDARSAGMRSITMAISRMC
jgi:hypothetical protein